MNYDVCVFTSTHQANDTRVYRKEVVSLLKGGFKVLYYTNSSDKEDSKASAGNEIAPHPNLKVVYNEDFNVEHRRGRFVRSFGMYFRIDKKCKVYHFHDPDLIFCGALLKLRGKKVIYDVHENYVDSISEKPYLSVFSRKVFSGFYKRAENLLCRRFDMIIAATPSIKTSYDLRRFPSVCIIYNYPFKEELGSSPDQSATRKSNSFIYVGGITEIRGITKLIYALEIANNKEEINLVLGGPVFPKTYLKELEALDGWKHVSYLGPLSRTSMANEFAKATCGLCMFLPLKNHVEAMPNKIFEYMSAGLPILCSDFELWKQLVIDNQVGFVCNPEDPESIASAFIKIANLDQNKLAAKRKRGVELIHTKFSWENEEKVLLELYRGLI